MVPGPIRPSPFTTAEAGAWADVLVRRRLPYAAVHSPTGRWLVAYEPDRRVRVLSAPAAMVGRAAAFQHPIRSTRPRTR